MILEGIVTTLNEDGSANVSPMGPIVEPSLERLTLRPFQTSTTYRNLKRTGQGVFHVTDDVELLARAAIGRLEAPPATFPATAVEGVILADACRWYAFRVTRLNDSEERTTIECEVVDRGRIRDFFGFNRAKHAVLEAAILATRIGILPAEQIQDEFRRLRPPVEKTAGDQERRAFRLLEEYIAERLASLK
jgi:uncharacterized protein